VWKLHEKIARIERVDIGKINNELANLRLERRKLELKGVSQAEVIEQWARLIGSNSDSFFTQKTEVSNELPNGEPNNDSG